MVALAGVDSTTVKVSSASGLVSPVRSIVAPCEVTPGAKVRVADSAAKSDPAWAVPLVAV